MMVRRRIGFGEPADFYGLDLMDITKLKSGTLYPLLQRLVAEGWLERSGPIPSDHGGAPRFNYKLTGVGAHAAARIVSTTPASAVAPSLPERPRVRTA